MTTSGFIRWYARMPTLVKVLGVLAVPWTALLWGYVVDAPRPRKP
jgi:hypothetical protein